jgi:cytochrome c556
MRPFKMTVFALIIGSGLSLAGCLPKPKQAYTLEQIPQINDLEEIMRVQAATMDPLFGKRGQASFTKEEFAAMAEGGKRTATTAGQLSRFAAGKKPSFATFAEQLIRGAQDLSAAAEAGDAAKVSATLGAMKDTCKGCHRENR